MNVDGLVSSNQQTLPGQTWWWYGVITCLAAWVFGDFLVVVMSAAGVPAFVSETFRIAAALALLLVFRQIHTDEPLLGHLRVWHLLTLGVLCWLVREFWSWGLAVPGFECRENTSGSKTSLQFVWLVVVAAPICEEIFFRHFLLRAFPFARSINWTIVAVIVTSAVFSISHLGYSCAVSFAALFFCGVIFSLARLVSGGLASPILLHAAYNAGAFI